ncbi:amine dehydrogenase large subunit [Gluconacetobacter diazotrophicus]|uniref:Putative methylamine dehydrogenase heavy chain n=1 Tax=Gluconacetobacter diazotrophicus (strain ATCC 49037 / DSM 5601 / CCUG 37298 / CIP 103539 / LMG 7603 / PAl5) TaxID=272568 RepID=A9HIB8_GLUDA|nr:amine dehydrogenase large subunit [Gluconacetobacter diazotrophicus]CAP55749.1 putative methylamine dehydrogenase heavy chain precursor [Gluconacetobacter diazotrophicus PA1 5]
MPSERRYGAIRPLAAPLSVAALLGAAILQPLVPPSGARAAEPILQTEESDIVTLPPGGPHRVLVQDGVYRHSKDGRVYVVDLDSGKLLGMVQAAYNANVAADPAGRTFYVAETAWERGNRGRRHDMLVAYNPLTLEPTLDIDLPSRALITPKKADMAVSADGHYVYVYDTSPTNSVHVFDAARKDVVRTVDVPGCALVYPWGGAGFSSICGDGSLANVALDKTATPSLTHTAPFFVPDRDPVFEHSPQVAASGHVWFISYSGLVYDTTLGPQSKIGAPWSIQAAAGLKPASDARAPFAVTWRPGGWQLAAVRARDSHLFILMHRGPFWTHKDAGTELWELDLKTRKLVRRIHLAAPSMMVGVTQDAASRIMLTDEAGDLTVLDGATGAPVRTIRNLGEALIFTVAPGE